MPDHPSEPERRWLLSELAHLCELAGPASLVAGPMLLPNKTTFPDSYSGDAPGVGILAQRLLTYAGLAAPKVRIAADAVDDDAAAVTPKSPLA